MVLPQPHSLGSSLGVEDVDGTVPRGIAARRARNVVAEFSNDTNDLWEIKMRPEPGFLSLVSLDFDLLLIRVIPFPFLLPDSNLIASCRG